jgi:hypothetical protein
MIQLVVNTNLLREIDERKLINAYARFMYNNKEDTDNDVRIKENLKQLLDWDENGDDGLGIYCSKFESIKEKDWEILINFIKENHHEIKSISFYPVKEKKLESIKVINDSIEAKKQHNKERFTSNNYQVSGRGKKARPCIYEGREYKSQQECMYKEGLTKYQIWKYLKDTNQI